LLLPSAWYAMLRLIGRPVEEPGRLERLARSLTRPVLLVLVIILVVLLGISFPGREVGMGPCSRRCTCWRSDCRSCCWLTWVGEDLPTGSLQRSWGVFASGLVLGPLLTLAAELIAILGLVSGDHYLSMRPDLLQEIDGPGRTAREFPRCAGAGPSADQTVPLPAGRYLPGFSFTAGIVPLIEELFKPVGVWLLAGRRLSPAEGFASGVISGAGFALFENLAFTSTGGEWTASVVLRMGTGLLHILTAGLTGWALALAWSHRRYLRLLVIFFCAVLLHAIWNGLALVTTASILNLPGEIDGQTLASMAAVALISITFIAFAILLGLNRALRRDQNLLST
jgi:hypothetical protein